MPRRSPSFLTGPLKWRSRTVRAPARLPAAIARQICQDEAVQTFLSFDIHESGWRGPSGLPETTSPVGALIKWAISEYAVTRAQSREAPLD
jgi:hypothetical protein